MIFLKMERRKTLLYFWYLIVRSRERWRKRKKGEESGKREEQNERGAKDERV